MVAGCVASLTPQEEIAEVLVVDDQSTDGTVATVRQMMARFPKARLLQTTELPAGWVGKNYAVWTGACEAQSEWLLFTDADAVHHSDSAKQALAIAAREDAAMVSFSPEQVMKTWYEKSLIPYVYYRLGRKFLFDQVRDPRNPAAAANGQFLMIRRDVYDAVGGHVSVKGIVLEDVALAKLVKSAGYRLWFGSGTGIVRVRMYRTFGAMWEGWKKNLYLLMGGNAASMRREIMTAILPILAVLLLAGVVGVLLGSSWTGFSILVLGFLGVSLAYGSALRNPQFPAHLAGYGIPGRLLFAAVLWMSYLSHRSGKLEWKGREYPAGTPGASK